MKPCCQARAKGAHYLAAVIYLLLNWELGRDQRIFRTPRGAYTSSVLGRHSVYTLTLYTKCAMPAGQRFCVHTRNSFWVLNDVG